MRPRPQRRVSMSFTENETRILNEVLTNLTTQRDCQYLARQPEFPRLVRRLARMRAKAKVQRERGEAEPPKVVRRYEQVIEDMVENGPGRVSDIAKRAGIPRPTVRRVLREARLKGAVYRAGGVDGLWGLIAVRSVACEA